MRRTVFGLLVFACCVLSSCSKEGPVTPAGQDESAVFSMGEDSTGAGVNAARKVRHRSWRLKSAAPLAAGRRWARLGRDRP
jgi:hypothetical protein